MSKIVGLRFEDSEMPNPYGSGTVTVSQLLDQVGWVAGQTVDINLGDNEEGPFLSATVERTFTREEVRHILNAGADLVLENLSLFEIETSASIRSRSLIDLVVNAQSELIDTPDATLDEVIEAAYSESPETVKEWIE